MKYILLTIILLISFVSNAKEIFPPKCKPLMVNDELLKLSAEKPVIVMIHNLSNVELWLTHQEKDSSANAGWSSKLQANNWSSLALTEKSFDISCIESQPGHEQQAPCNGLIAACVWSNVEMPESLSGTFWAGEDMTLSALTAHIGSRGVILPVH